MDAAIQVGRYRLIRLLATGGMGEVFLARHEGPVNFSRTVVVKRLLRHLAVDQAFVQMFLNEARLAALLIHPNIVHIYELGEHDGTYFIAMEYVPGTSLRSVLRYLRDRGERLPISLALHIATLTLHGLEFAHRAKDEEGRALCIVHRDVTPDNLLLSHNGSVKVADFGIAKAANVTGATRTLGIKGKYGYMAPEQFEDTRLDGRVDVFSLGVVLYEMLTGSRPFTGPTDAAVMRAVLDGSPTPPSLLNPEVFPELDQVVLRALARHRDQRFASARDFAAALTAITPISAAPSLAEALKSVIDATCGSAAAAEEDAAFQRLGTASIPESAIPTTVEPAARARPVDGPASPPSPFAPRDAGGRADTTSRPRHVRSFAVAAVAGLLLVSLVIWRIGATDAPAPATPAQVAVPNQPLPAPVASDPPPKSEGTAAASEPPPARTEAPRGKKETSSAKRTAPRPTAPGKVDVRVRPWAEVRIGGKFYGITPIPPIELPPGVHVVVLRNPELRVERKVKVRVVSGKDRMLRVDLRAR